MQFRLFLKREKVPFSDVVYYNETTRYGWAEEIFYARFPTVANI